MQVKRGETLVEILMALFILELILPSIFQGLCGGQAGVVRLRRQEACLYAAQWWFNRLPATDSLTNMPQAAPGGEPRFAWEVRRKSPGLREVALTVVPSGGDPITLIRAW